MTFPRMLGVLLLALGVSPALRAAADDETDQVQIKVRAMLDATNCQAMPPTVSVLGLTVDISTASLDTNADCEDCGAPVAATCADLTVGQVAEVKLASDSPDPTTGLLVATHVEMSGGRCEDGNCNGARIEAPLQSIDPNAPSVTVLGQVIDIGHAGLDGADDQESEDGSQPVDPSQLTVGQVVEATLVSSQAPLSATELEVKNFTNQIDVEVDDSQGNEVADNVQVDVEETVVVQASPSPGAAAMMRPAKHVKKTVRLHSAGNGHVALTGLPTGRAKITVTRGAATAHKRVIVKPNTTQQVKVRLR